MSDHPIHIAGRTGLSRRLSDRLGAPYPGALLATLGGMVVVAALGPVVADGAAIFTALALYCAGSMAALGTLSRFYPHAEFGAANTVTLLRLAISTVLVAAVLGTQEQIAWTIVALAAFCLTLDGVDGWLARRSGLTSSFGARFDMEVDCLFALALSLLVFESGKVGVWVLGLGLARYVFWAASFPLPWLAAPLPERRSRKVVCVAQIATLIALVTPLIQPPLASLIAAVILACVVWSFAVDVAILRRRRR